MKVVLLDGYNLIYRARHARMNKGEYSTVFNFFRSIRPLIEKFDPDLCYFVLEGKPVQRLSIDPEYKGQRTYHNKDNFSEQRRSIIRIIKEYFPFVTIRHANFECDDVIGHLANVTHKNDNVVIISSDTDFIQSINEYTQVYSPVRKCFLEKTDYDYVSWKSLVGDKSDNIPKITSVSPAKAKKVISAVHDKFGEGVISLLDDLNESVINSVVEEIQLINKIKDQDKIDEIREHLLFNIKLTRLSIKVFPDEIRESLVEFFNDYSVLKFNFREFTNLKNNLSSL